MKIRYSLIAIACAALVGCMDKDWNVKFHMLSQIPLDLVGIMQFLLSNVGRISKDEFK